MTVGEKIKALRLERGYSQNKLGELCKPKIDAANIRRIENNKANPTAETLKRIAVALQVRITDLFDLSEYEEREMLVANMPDTLCQYLAYYNGYGFKSRFDNGGSYDMVYDIGTPDGDISITSETYYSRFFNSVIGYANYEFHKLLEDLNSGDDK